MSVVIIDPLISCHEVSENDNGAMDLVAKAWGRVADLADCAVELVHHTEEGRGRDHGRQQPRRQRAGQCLPERPRPQPHERGRRGEGQRANHRLYFRTYSDKATLVPPADKSDWHKLESVDLCNGPPGESDMVGVVRAWKWPDAMAGMTAADFDKVATVIRAGKWRESSQAIMGRLCRRPRAGPQRRQQEGPGADLRHAEGLVRRRFPDQG